MIHLSSKQYQQIRHGIPDDAHRSAYGPLPDDRRPDSHRDSFGDIAARLISAWPSPRIFEAGCAIGFRIDDAPAISQGPDRKCAFRGLGRLTDPIAGPYDLIGCIEVLAQLPRREADQAIRNICAATTRVLFSACPDDHAGPAYDKYRRPIDWLRAFAEHGFAPVACFDPTFLRPWAIALEWSERPANDDLLLVHAELVAARITAWKNSEALKEELAAGRRQLHQAVNSLAARHAALSAKKPRIGLFQRFSRFHRRLQYLRQSIFFDPGWYARKYGDLAEGVDPAIHYLTTGRQEGRDPGPVFSAAGYLQANPDVRETSYDPLVHFERYGKYEGRRMAFRFEGVEPLVFENMPPPRKKKRRISTTANAATYQDWIERCDTLDDDDRQGILTHIETLTYQPLISVLMPAYETPPALLRQALDSVRPQLYPHWELCIADDASPSPHVAAILADYAARDARIRIVRREANGHISAATNSALELARGEFIALMDHDDLLAEHALYHVVVELNRTPDADLIYSDEDRVDEKGRRHDPYFKTDWNPELFLGHNIVSHLGVYRRSLVERIGGLRLGLEGSQDYDLALRVSRETSPDRIRHIPAILYHWRSSTMKSSFSERQLQRCVDAARRAKSDHLRAMGDDSIIEPHPFLPQWERVRRMVPTPAPLVSLIVPTHNHADLLRPCLNGLMRRTAYPNLEIIVIDHDSDEPETRELLREVALDPRVRVMPYSGAFNYSDMNNKAVAIAHGELIGLINNDVDVIDSDWLDEMVALASRPENGVVGAKLLYPDGSVQHAGVVLGVGGVAAHLHSGFGARDAGYFGRLLLASNVSAVTGACLVVRKTVYEEVGGLNATDLAVAFNDVDFSLKVAAKGYRNAWTPFALLFHHESPSRGTDLNPEKAARFRREVFYMQRTWGETLEADPFYNVNFSLGSSNFELVIPGRRAKPWMASSPALAPWRA
jgi:GT2 family glycosyltransferase